MHSFAMTRACACYPHDSMATLQTQTHLQWIRTYLFPDEDPPRPVSGALAAGFCDQRARV
ncbi:unnamed protein product, partial [Amoebophrya sp. A120]|eukprot:GSA120T00009432001.1